jgi:hypothetical protein
VYIPRERSGLTTTCGCLSHGLSECLSLEFCLKERNSQQPTHFLTFFCGGGGAFSLSWFGDILSVRRRFNF